MDRTFHAVSDAVCDYEKARHELRLVKSWLQDGGSVQLKKWIKRGEDSYLTLKDDKVWMMHSDGEVQLFCDFKNLSFDDYLLCPQKRLIHG